MTPLVLVDKHGSILEIIDETAVCGEDFCDRCHHCLHCLPDSSTCGGPDSDHVWVRYVL